MPSGIRRAGGGYVQLARGGLHRTECPQHQHFTPQSESVRVEVLDETAGRAAPGQIGKVVVSSLHNFAMPLLRYDIGDFAEVGEPAGYGRGLPVLAHILGRQRNLLVLPSGERRWPVFGEGERPEEVPATYQFQVVQRSRELIDVFVVHNEPYTPDEETVVALIFSRRWGIRSSSPFIG